MEGWFYNSKDSTITDFVLENVCKLGVVVAAQSPTLHLNFTTPSSWYAGGRSGEGGELRTAERYN